MAGRTSFSSSSSFSYRWKYDVFLSFRGLDTRFDFTGYLYKALLQSGIHTFLDDELQKGDEIIPSLQKAIKESRIAIPIFSQNYASSSFCLDELVYIIDCFKAKGRLVLPVFYDVDPSDVRHQRGSYGEALAKHMEMFSKYDKEKLEDNMERLKKWKMALKKAANLSGEHFRLWNEKYEHGFIGKIVEVVSNKINRAPLHVADYPVGLESRVLEVNSLLDVGSDDVVHMVGIHGIGGIGKTTLARTVYNLIADSFHDSCFLGSVRENSMRHGLVHLQEMLLSKIVGEKDIKLGDVGEGISIIKHGLHRKKVLLILDDVDKLEQLQAMVGGPDWFGPGSRVIITTRDEHLLASHGVERTYELDGLNMTEAIELLSWKAFRTTTLDPSYVPILNRVVTCAFGLPLALEVIGNNLFGRSVEEWKSALDRYQRIPNKEIQKIFKVDASEEDVQKFFALTVVGDPSYVYILNRVVTFASTVVGLCCYALSSSFNHLFGEWNLLKIFLYSVFSIIICLAMLFGTAWQHSTSLRFKAYLAFLVLAITSVYSFFLDKAVNGKPDAYILISCVAFAIMSFSLSRQIHCGFELDLLYFFLGCLIIQLMKINLLLAIVGVGFSYFLIILRSYLDAPSETQYLRPQDHPGPQNHVIIEVDPQQVNTDSTAPIMTLDAP